MVFLVGCETTQDPVGSEAASISMTLADGKHAAQLHEIARSLAVAMADEGARETLFTALRDSPFPQRALHLNSFLAGERGRSSEAPWKHEVRSAFSDRRTYWGTHLHSNWS
jgi:hypothetical protein